MEGIHYDKHEKVDIDHHFPATLMMTKESPIGNGIIRDGNKRHDRIVIDGGKHMKNRRVEITFVFLVIGLLLLATYAYHEANDDPDRV